MPEKSRKEKDKTKQMDKQINTYVEVISIFILLILTVFILVMAGVGFMLPEYNFLDIISDILLLFIVAEGIVAIMLLHRILVRLGE
ncbi:MAG: hypothetical protein QXJ96_01695 [Candidatus Aenigmatarchaeota archaeon]|nr:hypothetical protein [Candidatus Aenigmarchaeota archaeon]